MRGKRKLLLPLRSVLTLALLSTPMLGSAAKADEELEIRNLKRARAIMFPANETRSTVNWLTSKIHIKKKAGLAYTRPLNFGQRDMVLSVQGPVIRKGRYGLGFEVRF